MKLIEIDEGITDMLRGLKSQFTGDPQYKAWLRVFKTNPKKAEKMVGSRVHKQYIKNYGHGSS
tara:strand:- start:5618 stop:5806 length:189 start_codon:yes stop_codon:yes gene_type:complete